MIRSWAGMADTKLPILLFRKCVDAEVSTIDFPLYVKYPQFSSS